MMGDMLQEDAHALRRPELREAVMIVDNELHDEEIQALKFLCQNLVAGSKLKRVQTAHELMDLLESRGHLSAGNYDLILDLLQCIDRIDILESLAYEVEEVLTIRDRIGSKIEPFYILLVKISDDLNEEDVKKVAFMYGKIPRSQTLSCGLDVFTVMIHHQAIGPDNNRALQEIFKSIQRNDLVAKLENYSDTQGESVFRDLKETFYQSKRYRGQERHRINPHNVNSEILGPKHDDNDVHKRDRKPSSARTSDATSIPDNISRNTESLVPNPNQGMTPGFVPASDPAPRSSQQSRHNVTQTILEPDFSQPVVPRVPPRHADIADDPEETTPAYIVQGRADNELPIQPSVRPAAEIGDVANAPSQLEERLALEQALETEIIPDKIKDILAKEIPEDYWDEISNRLCVPLRETGHSRRRKSAMELHSRNKAVINQWLQLPTTAMLDMVSARIHFMKALYAAGPQLVAEKIAQELNINRSALDLDSMEASWQESVYSQNEASSAGSARCIPLESYPQHAPGADLIPRQMQQVSLQQQPQLLQTYKMTSLPRGKCLIINNRDFYRETDPDRSLRSRLMPTREGTEIDKERLMKTFSDLGFLVRPYDNLTDHEMVRIILEMSMGDHAGYDCFVCCILTHGIQGELYGVNGITVQIKDLTGPMRAQSCPTLSGKPKLFFLQACQGRDKQQGHPDIQTDALVPDSPPEMIPNEADFLLGYATVPGYVSYRSKTRGSWYITKLTELLSKHAFDHDILDILTLVNYEVGRGDAKMEDGMFKQSPAPMYSLRKKLIFRRPCN